MLSTHTVVIFLALPANQRHDRTYAGRIYLSICSMAWLSRAKSDHGCVRFSLRSVFTFGDSIIKCSFNSIYRLDIGYWIFNIEYWILKFSTFNIQHSIINIQYSIFKTQFNSTLNNQHSIFNAQFNSTFNNQTLNIQHSTLNTQYSTLNIQ